MVDFRDEFKSLLENTYISGKGSNVDINLKMLSFLDKVVSNIPEKLFRYRSFKKREPVLKSLEMGTITHCKARCFSDKYDSLIFVDAESETAKMEKDFRNALQHVLVEIKKRNPLLRPDKAARLSYYLEQGMTEREVIERALEEELSSYLVSFKQGLKNRESRFRNSEHTARIACFTESVQSKFMWDTYAGGYSGFALEYNLKGFMVKCFNMDIPAYVFPVIYVDERPDLTRDETNYYAFSMMDEKGWLHKLEPLRPFLDFNLLSPHKPFLYKDKEEYGHEREWRILYYDRDKSDDYIDIPDQGCLKAIYYGPDIKRDDYEMLHQIALRKGIAEYKVSIDENSRKYSLKVAPLKQ